MPLTMEYYVLVITAQHYLVEYFYVFLQCISYYSLGRVVLRSYSFESRAEEWVLSFGFGAGLFGTLLFLLGLSHALYVEVLWGLTALCWILGWRFILDFFDSFVSGSKSYFLKSWKKYEKLPIVLRILSLIFLMGLGVFIFYPWVTLPLFPSYGGDATAYHLPLAQLYLKNHYLILTPQLRYPANPALNNLLFVHSLALHSSLTAQGLQLIQALSMAMIAYALLIRFFKKQWLAILGALLFLNNDLVLTHAHLAMIDLGFAHYMSLSFLVFGIWLQNQSRKYLLLVGAFAGMAIAIKMVALYVVAALGLLILFFSFRQKNMRLVLDVSYGILLFGVPWYLWTWFMTGSPIFPMGSPVFHIQYWTQQDYQQMRHFTMYNNHHPRTVLNFLLLPYNLAYHMVYFAADGFFSKMKLNFLMLPFFFYAMAVDRRLRYLGLICAGYMLYWFSNIHATRYLLGTLPIYCAIMAAGFFLFAQKYMPKMLTFLKKPIVTFVIFSILLLQTSTYGYWMLTGDLRLGRWKDRGLGWLPVTQEQQESFLDDRIRGLNFLRKLKSEFGSHFLLYQVYSESLYNFVPENIIGDWVGPYGYGQFYNFGQKNRSVDFFEKLKKVGVTHLLWTFSPNLSEEPPFDAEFLKYFELLDQNPEARLYKLKNIK